MLRMVLAIASASVSEQNNDKMHQRAWAFVSEALTYAEEVLRPGSISGIQAILLLAQYSFVDPARFRSWYLVGMAAKVAIDLGLHQDPPTEVFTNHDRLDIRRRVFHCIYCLDRFVPFLTVLLAIADYFFFQRIKLHPTENLYVLRRICKCCIAITQRSPGGLPGTKPHLSTKSSSCFAYCEDSTDFICRLPRNALQWARTIPAASGVSMDSVLASSGVVSSVPEERP